MLPKHERPRPSAVGLTSFAFPKPPSLSDFEIEHLPGPIARALLEAARKGHAKGIVEQAQALEALGDPYVAYARRLRELGKQFRFEEICAIAEACAEAAARPA